MGTLIFIPSKEKRKTSGKQNKHDLKTATLAFLFLILFDKLNTTIFFGSFFFLLLLLSKFSYFYEKQQIYHLEKENLASLFLPTYVINYFPVQFSKEDLFSVCFFSKCVQLLNHVELPFHVNIYFHLQNEDLMIILQKFSPIMIKHSGHHGKYFINDYL